VPSAFERGAIREIEGFLAAKDTRSCGIAGSVMTNVGTREAPASSNCDIPRRARAARHWAGVISADRCALPQ
jgi:hypothetical protein